MEESFLDAKGEFLGRSGWVDDGKRVGGEYEGKGWREGKKEVKVTGVLCCGIKRGIVSNLRDLRFFP